MEKRVGAHGVVATKSEPQVGELRKAVDAIYAYPSQGKFTLVSRKAFNLLLANAMRQGVEMDWYEIDIADLAKDMRFDSNDMNYLEETLNSMQVTLLKWDVLETIEDKEVHIRDFVQLLGAVRLIGGVDGNGKRTGLARAVRYQFDTRVKQRLLVPEVYARINLQLQAEFKSSYTLALYEQVIRFKSNLVSDGWAYTVKLKWTEWRNLIVGGEHAAIYEQYKYFSRDVITKAIKELNERVSEFDFEFMVFKQGRSVTDLQFRLRVRAQQSLPLVSLRPIIDTEAITKRLKAFDLKAEEISKLITTVDIGMLENAADDTENRLKRSDLNPIRNVPAYFADALRRHKAGNGKLEEREVKSVAVEDDDGSPYEGDVGKKPAKGKESKGKWGTTEARFNELSIDDQEDLIQQFMSQVQNQAVVQAHAQKGLGSPLVRGAFMPWLEQNLTF